MPKPKLTRNQPSDSSLEIIYQNSHIPLTHISLQNKNMVQLSFCNLYCPTCIDSIPAAGWDAHPFTDSNPQILTAANAVTLAKILADWTEYWGYLRGKGSTQSGTYGGGLYLQNFGIPDPSNSSVGKSLFSNSADSISGLSGPFFANAILRNQGTLGDGTLTIGDFNKALFVALKAECDARSLCYPLYLPLALQSLIDPRTDLWLGRALADSRAATETLYRDWNGSQWVNKTLNDAYLAAGSPAFSETAGYSSPINANMHRRMKPFLNRMMDYALARTFYDPAKEVFPYIQCSNTGSVHPIVSGDQSQDWDPQNNWLRYPVVNFQVKKYLEADFQYAVANGGPSIVSAPYKYHAGNFHVVPTIGYDSDQQVFGNNANDHSDIFIAYEAQKATCCTAGGNLTRAMLQLYPPTTTAFGGSSWANEDNLYIIMIRAYQAGVRTFYWNDVLTQSTGSLDSLDACYRVTRRFLDWVVSNNTPITYPKVVRPVAMDSKLEFFCLTPPYVGNPLNNDPNIIPICNTLVDCPQCTPTQGWPSRNLIDGGLPLVYTPANAVQVAKVLADQMEFYGYTRGKGSAQGGLYGGAVAIQNFATFLSGRSLFTGRGSAAFASDPVDLVNGRDGPFFAHARRKNQGVLSDGTLTLRDYAKAVFVALKAECDARNLCYPLYLSEDLEQNIPTGAEQGGWWFDAINDPRYTTETVYREWDGTQWVGKTLHDAYVEAGSPAADPNAFFFQGANQGWLRAMSPYLYRMYDFGLSQILYEPAREVFPNILCGNYEYAIRISSAQTDQAWEYANLWLRWPLFDYPVKKYMEADFQIPVCYGPVIDPIRYWTNNYENPASDFNHHIFGNIPQTIHNNWCIQTATSCLAGCNPVNTVIPYLDSPYYLSPYNSPDALFEILKGQYNGGVRKWNFFVPDASLSQSVYDIIQRFKSWVDGTSGTISDGRGNIISIDSSTISNGSTTVTVNTPTTFTFTTTNAAGSATATATVTLSPTLPTINSFTVSASNIAYPGGNVTFTWTTTNATSVTINGATVLTNGSAIINVTTSAAYTLTALGPGGQATSSITVTVAPPPVVTHWWCMQEPASMGGQKQCFDLSDAQLNAMLSAGWLVADGPFYTSEECQDVCSMANIVSTPPPNWPSFTNDLTILQMPRLSNHGPSFYVENSQTNGPWTDFSSTNGGDLFLHPYVVNEIMFSARDVSAQPSLPTGVARNPAYFADLTVQYYQQIKTAIQSAGGNMNRWFMRDFSTFSGILPQTHGSDKCLSAGDTANTFNLFDRLDEMRAVPGYYNQKTPWSGRGMTLNRAWWGEFFAALKQRLTAAGIPDFEFYWNDDKNILGNDDSFWGSIPFQWSTPTSAQLGSGFQNNEVIAANQPAYNSYNFGAWSPCSFPLVAGQDFGYVVNYLSDAKANSISYEYLIDGVRNMHDFWNGMHDISDVASTNGVGQFCYPISDGYTPPFRGPASYSAVSRFEAMRAICAYYATWKALVQPMRQYFPNAVLANSNMPPTGFKPQVPVRLWSQRTVNSTYPKLEMKYGAFDDLDLSTRFPGIFNAPNLFMSATVPGGIYAPGSVPGIYWDPDLGANANTVLAADPRANVYANYRIEFPNTSGGLFNDYTWATLQLVKRNMYDYVRAFPQSPPVPWLSMNGTYNPAMLHYIQYCIGLGIRKFGIWEPSLNVNSSATAAQRTAWKTLLGNLTTWFNSWPGRNG